eukprot:15361903-Ditylum_brightwellii.AAC.1
MTLWTCTNVLETPFGKWFSPGSKLSRQWPFYYDYSESKGECNWVPTVTLALADCKSSDGFDFIHKVDCKGVVGNVPVTRNGTFQGHLDLLAEWENTLLDEIDMIVSVNELFAKYKEEPFLIATDGSSGDDSMSFMWKICTRCGDPRVQHAGPAFRQASLFQSEAYSMLS